MQTLKIALEGLAHQQFYGRMRERRGKMKFAVSLDELRADRAFDQHGDVVDRG